MAAVQGCIRKACAKHGIAYAQRVKLEKGEAVLVSEVVGAGDALHLSDYPVQFVPNPQSNGSMLTYAKRQLASIDWGICGDEDDDGQDDQECDGRAGHCPRSARKVRSRVRWRSNISFFSCGSAWS